MTPEQFEEAKAVTQQITKLKYELDIWQNKLVTHNDLGYRHPTTGLQSLNSKMPTLLFDAFRQSVMDNLRQQLQESEDRFAKL